MSALDVDISSVESSTTPDSDDRWFFVGAAGSFPDIAPSTTTGPSSSDVDDNNDRPHKVELTTPNPCAVNESTTTTADITDPARDVNVGCQIFLVPPPGDDEHATTTLSPLGSSTVLSSSSSSSSSQLLMFRHRGRIHAVDHGCPHGAYPLSRGSVYDIEDFEVVLSAGIVCPKHGWAFDLFSGEGDRGAYRLGVWEVKVDDGGGVWVRKRPRRQR